MSDIFREVDEDLRHEKYKKLWDRFGAYVIGLAVLIVVATAGWRLWEYWQQQNAQAAGDRFVAALTLADEGKRQEAEEALLAIAQDGSGRYPMLADFRIATEKAASGDRDGAVLAFDEIAGASGTSEQLRQLARLRAALLLVDTASLGELRERVGELAGTGGPWRHSAREILGLAAWRTGDLQAARTYYEEIAADQEKPADLQQRTQFMLALIRSSLGAPPATSGAGGEG